MPWASPGVWSQISAPGLEIDGSFSEIAGPTKLTGTPGPNTLTVGQGSTGGQFVKVAGAFTFSSKFAPSHFAISVPTLSIGGNLTVTETGSVGGGPEGLTGTSATIGGNLTMSANSAQPISLTEQFLTVSGKITVVEAGAGTVTIQSGSGLQSAALALKATAATSMCSARSPVAPVDLSSASKSEEV